MFRFDNPEYLYLLLLLPLLLGVRYFAYVRDNKRWRKLGEREVLNDLIPEYSSGRKKFKFFLIMLMFVLGVFLIARPQFGTKIENVKRQGVEVIVAMDVSNSMLATDVSPSRLQKAKRIVSQLIDGMDNDKVGLIVFAGKAYTQIPITSDYVSAKLFMNDISPSLVPTQGTAIGEAIDLAVRSFGGEDAEEADKKVGRAIIVITDGENFEDDARAAAARAAKRDILVHVVGVGTSEGAPIPQDGMMSFKKTADGETVITRLDEQMCGEIAQAGKGIYVQADNSNNAERVIGKAVDAMSKSDVVSKVYTQYDEQFQWIAFVLLVLLLCEIVISERKNDWIRKWKIF
ncbi:MAG: VWA domain-containing protein [Paludibacteraceae bacterium]|nr:VWA domain-containing protein [Paludibacteraceae bacterium]